MEMPNIEHIPNKEHGCNSMDRISELPEELLVHILHSLSLKEAARTSLVSRIWRDLWKFVTASLNFEASKTFLPSPEQLQKERDVCVEWITRVLNSHKAPTIDELRICFDLTQQHSHDIHRWIEIALMKRVKRIELDFTPRRFSDWRFYAGEDYMFAPLFCGSPGIKFLTSLCFKHVNISGQVVETFLSGCPLLESLHVSDSESQQLTNLNVCGSSLRLKHLHISFWSGIKRIEVYAPNLVSFEYSGMENGALRIHLKYVPQLRDVSYGVPYGVPWDSIKGDVNFCQAFPSCLSTCVSQLVDLSLQFDADISIRGCPKLPNLRYLTCKVRYLYLLSKRGLINLLSLVDSSPLLHKFKVELEEGNAIRMKKGSKAVRKLIKEVKTMIIKDGKRDEMQRLSEVEIAGFTGAKPDTALLVYLANTALNLDNIVINTCCPHWDHATLVYKRRIEKLEEARELAYDLLSDYRPEGAKFMEYKDNLVDRISELPQELLVRILWKFVTVSINFDASKTLMLSRRKLQKHRDKYVRWITRVLNSHIAPTIGELRIRCDLNHRYTHNINGWIEVALMKKVKRLELDFKSYRLRRHRTDSGYYLFGREFCGSSEIKFLTSLCFKHVEVSGEVLESLLSNCPLLETLHVSHSPSVELKKLDVCGSSLRLKHLHISSCKCLQCIVVYAPNLVSFEYSSRRETHLVLSYVPQLRDVSYGVQWDFIRFCGLQAFPRCLLTCVSQLVILSVIFTDEIEILPCPTLPNLRYLTCEVRSFIEEEEIEGLLKLLHLVDSSPLLHKFKVELEIDYDYGACRLREGRGEIEKVIKGVETMINNRRRPNIESLREVEIVGFFGAVADIALLIYLAKTALNLENIVINTCPAHWYYEATAPEKVRQYRPEGANIHVV